LNGCTKGFHETFFFPDYRVKTTGHSALALHANEIDICTNRNKKGEYASLHIRPVFFQLSVLNQHSLFLGWSLTLLSYSSCCNSNNCTQICRQKVEPAHNGFSRNTFFHWWSVEHYPRSHQLAFGRTDSYL